jgi:hypothetical protein
MESELKAYHRLYSERFVLREKRPAAGRRTLTARLAWGGGDQAEVWLDESAVSIHQAEVAKTLGRPDGVLALTSYALSRPYPGLVADNRETTEARPGPATVVLAYISSAGATLLDRRLFLPEAWFDDGGRRAEVDWAVPAWVTFKTGPALGAEMVLAALAAGLVPVGWVALDQAYSHESRLIDELHQRGHLFILEAARDSALWRRQPAATPKSFDDWEPGRADVIAARLPGGAWEVMGDDEIAATRIALDRRGQPGAEGWLIVRRPAGILAVDRWQFFLSNAPAHTAPLTLASLTGWQEPVAAVLDDCHVEPLSGAAPGWAGWHHHATLTMLAHHFLVQLRLKFGAAAPVLNVPQARRLLQAVLLRREFDVTPAVAEIERIQRQNLEAYYLNAPGDGRGVQLHLDMVWSDADWLTPPPSNWAASPA